MGSYTVEFRGPLPLGSDKPQHLADAKHLVAKAIEADSPREAVAQAMQRLPENADPDLFFVPDESGGVDVFWPDGNPMGFERHIVQGPTELVCAIRVTEQCEVRGTADGDALFVIGRGEQRGLLWVCESCAPLIERLA